VGRKSAASRRTFLKTSIAGGITAAALPVLAGARVFDPATVPSPADIPSFELDEISISDLQNGMKSGKYSARSIAEKYLSRIDAIDKSGPAVNSIIELNPDALAIADSLDKERQAGKLRSPLHGIPILIKDNVATADKMMTTAGSLALVGAKSSKDSTVAEKLRAAGAVILGKTNLSEWANIRSSHSTSGWSGRGGLTKNPYALDRNACGSSSGSGVATAANLCAAAIGSETDGSIVCPSNANGIVGIKPTLGLISRSGIVPIAHSQDTAGPMARTVADAAALLSVLTGVDSDDSATSASQGKAQPDYTRFLDANGLKGARIGVARKYFGFTSLLDPVMNAALDTLKSQGATLIDPADIATDGKFDDSEFLVLLYELKADLNAYLSRLSSSPVRTLKDVIEFNEKNKDKEMPYFAQDVFLKAEAKGGLNEKEYVDALEKNHRLARTEGIDAIMDKNQLDALVAPTGGPASLTDLLNGDHFTGGSSSAAAVAGYPNINVPAGFVHDMPVGISFFGRAWSEPTLIKIAYAYEQATKHRKPPRFLPTIALNPRG
jgi:amidase